jgi:GDP-4-dehydro-6-deoxy-D-mannose reductase
MSTLVIAANSFIGRAVYALLPDAVATTRATGCDLLDATGVDRLIASIRPVRVINCAGAAGRAPAAEQYALHVGGTLNLLEAMRRHAPHAVAVLLGSAAEYGEPAVLPTPEDAPTRPLTFYGASKLAQTHLAAACAAEWGLRIVTARLFNVIGPGLPERYFLAALAARLRSSQDATFPLDAFAATRDFIDVRDAASALVALCDVAVPGRMEVANVGSGEAIGVADAARRMGELAGGRVPVDSGRAGGVMHSRADIRKIRTLTGWVPEIGWRESVAAVWAG